MENIIINQLSTSPEDPHGTERRFSLLKRNRELAEHAVSQTPDEDVVVLIIDLESHDLAPIANAVWCKQVIEDGCIPAMVYLMARWNAYKMLRTIQRTLHRLDHRDPPVSPIVERLNAPADKGFFYVMVISKGKQLATLPII